MPDLAAVEPFVVMAKPVGATCNLDCTYCYYLPTEGRVPSAPGRMTDEVLEAYVSAMVAAAPGPDVHFVWHGGEPTLAGIDFYRRVVAAQRAVAPEGWQCVNSIQTNGTLLDDRWAAFLAEEHFAVGLSLDGPAVLHDATRPDRRGRPTHERARRGLAALRAHGIEPDVLCTVNATTATAPLDVYRFFLDQRVRWVQFLPVVQRAADGGLSRQSVTAEALGTFLTTIFDEWVRHDVASIGVQTFLEPILPLNGRHPTLCTMSETCGRALALERDGSLYACDHFVDLAHRLGDVRVDDLAGLVDGSVQTSFGAAKRDGLTATCQSCPVLVLCRGGCPKDRFGTSPEGEAGHNVLCAGYLAFFTHARPLLERLATLARRGRPLAGIVDELRVEEADSEAPWRAAGRNDPCPCGSGRKYKHCCLGAHRRR
ncbi:MAG: anaerobic sulfatase maturase [Acidimicrobiales bacterium]